MSLYHEEKDVNLVVHGDDFTFTGEDVSLRWVEEIMRQWYELKVHGRLGLGDQDDKEATLLGRIVRCEAWRISCEANPKYRESVLARRTRTGTTTRYRRYSGMDRMYRSIVATINYMSTDMLDLQFACKEACREMSAPTVQSWKKVKLIGRYFLAVRRWCQCFLGETDVAI